MDRRDGRTMCGYAICSGELAGKLLRNKAVYAMNRGGVTLTGGEPLLQAAFAAEVLAALQAAGVHTAVETSGYAAPEVFRRVAGHADLVLFDVKHADPVQHRRWTGVDNAPILRNLAWLCTSGRPFVVRIPLIPGVNDTRENMLQTCLLAGAGRDPALPQDRRGEVRHDRPDVCPRFRYRGGAPCPRRFQRLQS